MGQMLCKWVEDNLLAYHEGTLGWLGRSLVQGHLRQCSECVSKLTELVETAERVRELRNTTPGQFTRGTLSSAIKERVGQLDDGTAQAYLRWSGKPPVATQGRKRVLLATAMVCTLLIALLLPGIGPWLLRTGASIPGIDSYLKRIIYRDAGLDWAWEHGYLYGKGLELSNGQHKLSVLGYAADPIQTSIILLISGPEIDWDPEEDYAQPYQVFIADRTYLRAPPIVTPIGLLQVLHISPVEPAGEEVEVKLELNGEELIGHKLFITPEAISKVSTEQQIEVSGQVEDIVLRATRIVTTPGQVMIDVEANKPIRFYWMLLLDGDTGQSVSGDSQLGWWLDGMDANRWGATNWPLVFSRLSGKPTTMRLRPYEYTAGTGEMNREKPGLDLSDKTRDINYEVLDWGNTSRQLVIRETSSGMYDDVSFWPRAWWELELRDGRRIAEYQHVRQDIADFPANPFNPERIKLEPDWEVIAVRLVRYVKPYAEVVLTLP